MTGERRTVVIPRTARMFIAIAPAEATCTDLARIFSESDQMKWQSSDSLHVTLKFLGQVDEKRADEVAATLREIQVEPYNLSVEGMGVFPNENDPQVLWAGLGNGHPRLHQLRKNIEDALIPLGFEPERKAFVPHITLARLAAVSAEHVRQFLKAHQDFQAAPWTVESFGLYTSRLSAQGAEHTLKQDYPLKAA